MKKKTIFSVAALIIVAIVSVTVMSCKKDNEKEEAVLKNMNADAQVLLDKIEAFQTLRKTVNSGAKTDGTMTINEMRDIIDLASNYEHSQHEACCLNTILDTIHVAMPMVDVNGNVSDVSVVSVYNTFEAELDDLILSIGDGMVIPSYFSVILPEETDDDDIDFVFIRGEQDDKHTSVGPFIEGDDFKWGMRLGRCPIDSTERLTDAAIELSRKFKFQPDYQHQGQSYIIYMVEHADYTSYLDELSLPGYIYHTDPSITCANDWLYYQSGDFEEEPCIDYNEMNCLWNGIRDNVSLPTSDLFYSPKKHVPYHECWIEAIPLYFYNSQKRPVRVHVAHVTYCYIAWSENPHIED